jgi:hypothetical protein
MRRHEWDRSRVPLVVALGGSVRALVSATWGTSETEPRARRGRAFHRSDRSVDGGFVIADVE